ncbi:MAG: hypothetical protein ACNYZH_02825 [Acidimicrobiia bacterium]
MTMPRWERDSEAEGAPSLHVVVATHTREVKTALFLALNAMPAITIVATATSTAELASYCHAFRPDFAIVESGLPGRRLDAVLAELAESNPDSRVLLIDEHPETTADLNLTAIQVFTDLDQLIATFPQQGA